MNASNPDEQASPETNAGFDYESFIDGFEEVTYWHFDWYSRIMGTLLYNTPRPTLSEHECRFGRFLETHGAGRRGSRESARSDTHARSGWGAACGTAASP